jgi:glutamine synthetase
MPWAKPGHDLLFLSNYGGRNLGALCPRSILARVLARAADGRAPEIRDGTGIHPVRRNPRFSARAKGYRDLKTATRTPAMI